MTPQQTPVAVVGALGRMGERVRDALETHPDLELAAALEAPGHPGLGRAIENGVRVTDDAKAAFETATVAIDFSLPASTLTNLRVAADGGVAYVTGTTGFDDIQSGEIETLAQRTAVLHAPNFSLSVNLLVRLAAEAARVLGDDVDAEIIELHHAMKRDAPSGTALRHTSGHEATPQGSAHKRDFYSDTRVTMLRRSPGWDTACRTRRLSSTYCR